VQLAGRPVAGQHATHRHRKTLRTWQLARTVKQISTR
jgi:hypothetical protein